MDCVPLCRLDYPVMVKSLKSMPTSVVPKTVVEPSVEPKKEKKIDALY